MKSILLVIILSLVASFTAEAGDFYVGIPAKVGSSDVMLSLRKIVELFDAHAQKMGGAGFLYGIKSKLIGLFDNSHRDLLEKYIRRTPEYMLYTSEIPDDDPNLFRTFAEFCKQMPTVYDTYEKCREKILQCIKMTFPVKSDKFYQNELNEIKKATNTSWL